MTMLVYQRVQSGWWLVLTPSEKYDFVKWDYEVLNWMETYKKCSKAPTSSYFMIFHGDLLMGLE